MNKVLITIALVCSINAMADEPSCSEVRSSFSEKESMILNSNAPKGVKGIIIVNNDGTFQSELPIKRFKVVPRVQQRLVTVIEANTLRVCTSKPSKNRASVLAGYGARNGLSVTRQGNVTTVESSSGAVGGAQYQRMLNDKLSIGAQVQTNSSASVLLGVDF